LYAHNDNDPPEIPFPGTTRARQQWRRSVPWAVALVAHAGLAAVFFAAIAPRGETAAIRGAPDDTIIVTLVERPAPAPVALVPTPDPVRPDLQPDAEPAASDARATEPEAAQPDAGAPVDFAVNVAPRPGTATLVLPRVPRFTAAQPETAPIAGDVRQALADAEVCRAFAPADERIAADCPQVPDRSAEIELAGLEPSDFLDPALGPPPGTAEFEVGPLAVSLTLFGSGPTPYRLTIKPRPQHDKSLAAPPTVTAV
jgi:hypothetical protein